MDNVRKFFEMITIIKRADELKERLEDIVDNNERINI